ncbi:MAG: glycosyltransferase family 2 protein [Deltaproteobacteria bacterium]
MPAIELSVEAPRPGHPLVSIVVPVLDEQDCIDELLERVAAVLEKTGHRYEIIVVDDGSKDRTLDSVKARAAADRRIKFVSFSRNFGHQMALAAGIEYACGDAIISMDGDLQHPPELIPELLDHWQAGTDVVYTVRSSNSGHALKEAASRAFYALLRALSGVDIPTAAADFRLIDRKVADALKDCDEHFVFVRGLVPWLGFSSKAVAYDAGQRYGGKTKYLSGRMLKFALDGIFSFSIVPLRLISLMGAITITLGLIYGAYSIGVRLFSDTAVSGWTSLVIVMLVFSGTQLLSLGILSEYVGRIYEEVKKRPRYVVKEQSPNLGAEPPR